MSKKKLLVFHPALAPYRIDFFNSLTQSFDAKFYFYRHNLANQKFDQDKLSTRADFKPRYLTEGRFSGNLIELNLFRILIKEKPDIVIGPEYKLINLLLVLYRFFFSQNYKIITLCDDNLQMTIAASPGRKILRSIYLKFLDGFILTNNAVKKWYLDYLKPNARIFVFPIVQNDLIFRKELHKSENFALELLDKYNLANKKIVLFVGRLVDQKNIKFLIEGFSSVREENKDTRLIIVGSGENESDLKNKAKLLGHSDSILFPGRFEGIELMGWFQIAHLFVLPSKFEPFGAVTNEALLSGCYVLCSNVAGSRILIEPGVNGQIFDPNDLIGFKLLLSETLNEIDKEKNILSKMPMSYKEYIENLTYELKNLNQDFFSNIN